MKKREYPDIIYYVPGYGFIATNKEEVTEHMTINNKKVENFIAYKPVKKVKAKLSKTISIVDMNQM